MIARRRLRTVWSLRDVRFRHAGAARPTIDDVTLDVARGRMTALLGPNGAGKSTLLQLLLGTLDAGVGRGAASTDRPLAEWTRRELAREIGVVPQGETEPLFSVREIVAMGRYPYLGPWQRERPEDVAAIAARWSGATSRRLPIDGSRRSRAASGSACAWRARSRRSRRVLVLDEPTTFLDIRHEMTTFELLRDLRDEGTTVVLATHNLNLAARYADELVLLRSTGASSRAARQPRC